MVGRRKGANKQTTLCWLVREMVTGEESGEWWEAERRGHLGVFPPNMLKQEKNLWHALKQPVLLLLFRKFF